MTEQLNAHNSVAVERLSELDWLTDITAEAGKPTSGMAELLHQHQDAAADNGGRYCICGEWEGSWTGTAFAQHQAQALHAAGFGLMR